MQSSPPSPPTSFTLCFISKDQENEMGTLFAKGYKVCGRKPRWEAKWPNTLKSWTSIIWGVPGPFASFNWLTLLKLQICLFPAISLYLVYAVRSKNPKQNHNKTPPCTLGTSGNYLMISETFMWESFHVWSFKWHGKDYVLDQHVQCASWANW